MQVKISLLGKCEVVVDGRTISTFRSAKIPAILGLLAHHRKGLTREQIASTLWPNALREEGLHNFRQCLLYIRKSLHPDVILATKREVALHAEVATDLDILTEPTNRGAASKNSSTEFESRVLDYQGDFLEGIEDAWILPIRSHYQKQYVSLLHEQAKLLKSESPKSALDLIHLAIRYEPFNESLRAESIAILRQFGSEAEAHLEFSKFESFLISELGIAPSDIVRSALTNSLVPPTDPNPTNSESPGLAAAVEGLLSGSRPVLGLDLALAFVPTWIKTGEYHTGIQCLRAGLTHFSTNAPLIEIELVRIAIAELLAANREPEAARDQLGKCLPQLTHDEAKLRAHLLCAKMELIAHRGETARHFTELALANKSITAHRQLHIDALIFAAKAAFLLDEQSTIEPLVEECLRLSKPLNDLQAFAECTVLSVHGLFARNEIEKARAMATEALSYLKNREGVPAVFSRITIFRLFDEIGDLKTAEAGYRQGISESKILGHKYSEVIVETYLGDLLSVKGEYEESLLHHKIALEIRTIDPDRLGQATSLRGIGRALMGLGKISEARKSFEESAQAFLACGGMPGHVSVLFELAKVAILMGDIALAHRLATRTIDLASAMTDHQIISIGPSGRYLRDELKKLVIELDIQKAAFQLA